MSTILRGSVAAVTLLVALSFFGGSHLSAQSPPKPDPKLVAYGKHLSGECSACHRIDGVDNGIPSITGWDPEEFVTTMNFYRNGERTNPAMVSVAQSMDEEQFKALAAFYGSLPKGPRHAKKQARP